MTLTATALLSLGASAQHLYAVSVRTYSDVGYKGVEGNLYDVVPESAVTTLRTSITLDGVVSVGLDGLAIHPRTGVFYGITAPTSAVIPRSLVKLDVETGRVSLIGDLGYPGSDIGFDEDGTLFIWLPDTRQLGTVNLDTGAVTPRGRPAGKGALKGGFTVIGPGRALVATTGATGTIDTIDLNTGAITTGPKLVGAPFGDLITGLAYLPPGRLFAINATLDTPSSAKLVDIDTKTGQVTSIGTLPIDTDALAFGRSIDSPVLTDELSRWRVPVLAGLFLFAVVFLVAMMQPWKKP
jgi:hypothetical protein